MNFRNRSVLLVIQIILWLKFSDNYYREMRTMLRCRGLLDCWWWWWYWYHCSCWIFSTKSTILVWREWTWTVKGVREEKKGEACHPSVNLNSAQGTKSCMPLVKLKLHGKTKRFLLNLRLPNFRLALWNCISHCWAGAYAGFCNLQIKYFELWTCGPNVYEQECGMASDMLLNSNHYPRAMLQKIVELDAEREIKSK